MEDLTGIPPELDVRAMGFGPERPRTESESAEMFGPEQGFGTIIIPPDIFDADVRHLAVRIVRSVYRMEPAWHPLMKATYRMLSRLADARVTATPGAVVVGLLLGLAKVHGVQINTHTRDLAKDVGTRYAVLLKIRQAAIAEIKRLEPGQIVLQGDD